MIIDRLHNYLGLVRFSHTVFALPFALMSALVAAGGLPTAHQITWILVCMVTARTSAMTFNRLVDRDIDAENPRTKQRHIPSGKVSVREAIALWGVMSASFVYGAYQLNWLCFALSPLALLIICGYSYTKRFSSLSHLVLGFSLGIAPLGAWFAVTGQPSPVPLLLGAAVMLWVAGFDVIYALMDESFDRQQGLHSLVVRFGRLNALRAAFTFHLFSVLFAAGFGWVTSLGWVYITGVLGFAGLVLYQHAIVNPNDHKKINLAFFNVNAVISMGLFICAALEVFWKN